MLFPSLLISSQQLVDDKCALDLLFQVLAWYSSCHHEVRETLSLTLITFLGRSKKTSRRTFHGLYICELMRLNSSQRRFGTRRTTTKISIISFQISRRYWRSTGRGSSYGGMVLLRTGQMGNGSVNQDRLIGMNLRQSGTVCTKTELDSG